MQRVETAPVTMGALSSGSTHSGTIGSRTGCLWAEWGDGHAEWKLKGQLINWVTRTANCCTVRHRVWVCALRVDWQLDGPRLSCVGLSGLLLDRVSWGARWLGAHDTYGDSAHGSGPARGCWGGAVNGWHLGRACGAPEARSWGLGLCRGLGRWSSRTKGPRWDTDW